MKSRKPRGIFHIVIVATLAVLLTLPGSALLRTSSAEAGIVWQGHTWRVTNGHMAGVAPGSPRNVSVDSNGYLHLSIKNSEGKWTAGELFTEDTLGFGTYQWLVEGNVWTMDPVTVLGLFPYGPAKGIGKDGTNEIDIEFSQWDNTCSCNADFTIYPPVRRAHGDSSFNLNFSVNQGTTLTTARMVWSAKNIVFTLMSGDQPLGTTANVLKTATYQPKNTNNIPQQPLPVGINFWAFKALPKTDQSVVIRSFQYVP
jgi:hypothetical protein